ncbi:MAG: glycerate kinase [Candidatus Brocadiales bacterium]|nr:glycerate kinase [Candidatus Bathyanammoxibius amoris]
MPTISELRRDARDIFDFALKAVDPAKLVRQQLRLDGHRLEVAGRKYDLRGVEKIFLIAAGKAAAPMAETLEDVLGDRLGDGIVVVKYGYGLPFKKMRVIEAGHPVPDRKSTEAAGAVLKLASRAGKKDLVICLLSGGGSALLCGLPEGITIADLKSLTKLLLASGADIKEMNTVRKHVSVINGGRLAKTIYPAGIISIIISDVVGNELSMVASGPTLPIGSTFKDAIDVLDKYNLTKRIPRGIYRYLKEQLKEGRDEGPAESAPCFKGCHSYMAGSNERALEAAERRARKLGYNSIVLSSSITGEAREVAGVLVSMAKEVSAYGRPVRRPACLLAGGETTVTIKGRGKGGRSQEFALAAALQLDDCNHTVVLSGGTDGTDGPTDADGAMVDTNTRRRAEKRFQLDAADYLDRNDSYNFFKKAGGHLITGPTRTNVTDIMMALIG